MFFKLALQCVFAVLIMSTSACMEDLAPSNNAIQDVSNNNGLQGSVLDDISLTDNNLETWQLSQALTEADAVALYFTMWCPVCDSHMQHIKHRLVKDYPNVTFIFIDYVSSSIYMSQQTQVSSGYQSSLVIADTNDELQHALSASMSTFVIVDKNFTVQYNQVFQGDSEIRMVLNDL